MCAKKVATIIIPTKDKITRLRLTLKALEPQIKDDIEVIIIMDGCSNDTITQFNKLQLSYKPKTIILTENIGRAAARNKGIKQASGNIIIFLDDDRIPCKDFVTKHIECHKTNCVVMGARKDLKFTEKQIEDFYHTNYLFDNFDKLIQASKKERFLFFRFISKIFGIKLINSISFMTGNASVKKEDIIKAGMFDENFTGWGYEDVDLGYRLTKLGLKFKRESGILNYHLDHPFTRRNEKNESKKSLEYFLNKIKKDKLALFISWMYFVLYTNLSVRSNKNYFIEQNEMASN